MITVKKKMTIPEYRERKKMYELLGYKEVEVKNSDYKTVVTLEIDETDKHYPELMKVERRLFRKGPPFFPVMIFVALSFVFLSVFVIILARDGEHFDLTSNAFSYLLPAFLSLAAAVIYSILYFSINKKIIDETPELVDNLDVIVEEIRKK